MTKSIFIIGAGNGIGAATAERFGHAGSKVLLGASDSIRLQQLVTRLTAKGLNVEGIPVDATDPASVATAMRTTDWAGECTIYPREIAEAALAHLVGDETERAYRRGDALEKRRALMESWASFCLQEEAKKVITLPLRSA